MRKQNLIKLFVIVLATSFLMISCLEKGGTIKVKNSWTNPALVMIIKGIDGEDALDNLKKGKGETIASGDSKVFSFDEDGTYTVVALEDTINFPKQFVGIPPAILLAGNTAEVTIK